MRSESAAAPSPGMASIIIPAHNEEDVIQRCLQTLLADATAGEFEVVVVCNGCTDRTATAARSFDRYPVVVLDIATPSKTAALAAGDAIATGFPRVYLDADVDLTTDSARRTIAVLVGGALVAAPLPRLDTTGCGWVARRYFEIWSRLGYANRHMIGSGVFALSEQGRSRFGQFPDIIADDAYVAAQFGLTERINPVGASFVIRPPRTLGSLFRRRTRIVAGNLELAARFGLTPASPPPGPAGVLRTEPKLALSFLVFTTVNLGARYCARRQARRGRGSSWSQDRSSRSS